MVGKGDLSSNPNRRLRVMVAAHLSWIAVVCLLGAWWGRLLLRQAARIAELEGRLGIALNLTQSQWHRTQRMLYWESLSFFGLLLACTGLLFWLFWRDLERARGLQAFFASVTHELRTPLTSIRLQAESIAESLESQVSEKKLVDRLLQDTLRLEAQVERTLELARVEGGGPVYIQHLQIKPWLDRFLKTWSADYLSQVELDTKVEDVWIEADPTAMQIILKNLLENSVRHSKQDKVRISIHSQSGPSGVSVVVRDNGLGFVGNAQSLGQIFQKGPVSQGTGVGLYLVNVLMRRMGGKAQFRVDPVVEGFEVSLTFAGAVSHG